MAAPASVSELLENLNESIASRRRTLRLIETPRFQFAYQKASTASRLKAMALVSEDNQEGIEDWLCNQLQQQYTEMNSRELRDLGRKFGIKYYAQLPKATLLSEIIAYARSAGHLDTGGVDNKAPVNALLNDTISSYGRC